MTLRFHFTTLLVLLASACTPPPEASSGSTAAEDTSPRAHEPRMKGPAPDDVSAEKNASAVPKSAPRVEPRAPTEEELARYSWLTADARIRPLEDVVAPPAGTTRVSAEAGTFGSFLRRLPLRPAGTPVLSYAGGLLRDGDDPCVLGVAELDVSNLDVQQCADSVIRLHAEWQWSMGEKSKIGYHFLSGDYATWPAYSAGSRPTVNGNKVAWSTGAKAASDRPTFRKYLDMVFNYASTISLARKSSKTITLEEARPGDFFVLPGGPGHAILILDMAVGPDGKKHVLLGQGFMPAQDFHVLRSSDAASPWFTLDGDSVDTPFWPDAFPWSSLRRML